MGQFSIHYKSRAVVNISIKVVDDCWSSIISANSALARQSVMLKHKLLYYIPKFFDTVSYNRTSHTSTMPALPYPSTANTPPDAANYSCGAYTYAITYHDGADCSSVFTFDQNYNATHYLLEGLASANNQINNYTIKLSVGFALNVSYP